MTAMAALLSSTTGNSENHENKPFVIEHLRQDEKGGYFTPAARLILTRVLRTGGLLASLSDVDARSLLLLLTFVRSDGRCEVSAVEAASALALSVGKARERLEHLSHLSYEGMPLVRVIRRVPDGLDGFVLGEGVVAEIPATPNARSVPASGASGSLREEIIAHSREQYAHPRGEVEAQVLRQLGYPPQQETRVFPPREAKVRNFLSDTGIAPQQIEELLASAPLERIEEQIAWLPHRHARNPAKFLVAAILHQYDPPAFVRLQHMIAQDDAAAEAAEHALEAEGGKDA